MMPNQRKSKEEKKENKQADEKVSKSEK